MAFLAEAELLIPSLDEKQPLSEKVSASDRESVEKIVRSVLKDKASEEHIVRIVRNVLVQLYKTFYNRRSFWSADLNAHSD